MSKVGTGAGATIVVEVPGKNEQDLFAKIGKTAKMGFRPVLLSGSPIQTCAATATPTPSASPSASASASGSPSASSTPSPSTSSAGRPGTGLLAASSSPTPTPSATTSPSTTATPSPTPTECDTTGTAGAGYTAAEDQAFNTLDCTNASELAARPADLAKQVLITCEDSGAEKYILGPELVPGTDITGAERGPGHQQQRRHAR